MADIPTQITSGGRIVIPAPMRRALGLKDGDEVLIRLEGGELPLEESLKAFERGVALTRECQVALEAAQARVDILLKRDGEVLARPFDDEAEGGPEIDGDHSPA